MRLKSWSDPWCESALAFISLIGFAIAGRIVAVASSNATPTSVASVSVALTGATGEAEVHAGHDFSWGTGVECSGQHGEPCWREVRGIVEQPAKAVPTSITPSANTNNTVMGTLIVIVDGQKSVL
jgi:hypothetical protein